VRIKLAHSKAFLLNIPWELQLQYVGHFVISDSKSATTKMTCILIASVCSIGQIEIADSAAQHSPNRTGTLVTLYWHLVMLVKYRCCHKRVKWNINFSKPSKTVWHFEGKQILHGDVEWSSLCCIQAFIYSWKFFSIILCFICTKLITCDRFASVISRYKLSIQPVVLRNGDLPEHFGNCFSDIASVHKYQTRLACLKKYHLSWMKPSLGQYSSKYIGPKI